MDDRRQPLPTPGVPDFSAVPWTTNDVELLGNYTNGTPSLAATASSWNHPGQYDISLITPTFHAQLGIRRPINRLRRQLRSRRRL